MPCGCCTDTLAYSAAALSFLLLGLPVPVLLTGSMLPAGAEGSDAWANLFGAMQALQQGAAPGVQLYCNCALMHGARASKLASAGLVSAGGITREATLGKLFALLCAGMTQAEVEHGFALGLCGERADSPEG